MQHSATQLLESLSESDIREKIKAIDRERKALLVLLRAVRRRDIGSRTPEGDPTSTAGGSTA